MTKRDFYLGVIEAGISEEMTAFAQAEIDKLDATNARRAEKNAEKRAAEQPLYDAVVAVLTEDPQTASDIKAQVEAITSVQKATSILKKLVNEGFAVQGDIRIKGRNAKGYTKA